MFQVFLLEVEHEQKGTDALVAVGEGVIFDNKIEEMGMILIVFFAPFVGLAIRGLGAAVIGVILSIAAYYLAPYIVQSLTE